jgi:hypothetical protein
MDDKTRDALSKPFTGDIVRQKKGQGGRLMDYVSHGGVTKRLNEVAPDWEATMVERFIVGDGDKLHCLGGVMRLTIGGVTREEAGGPARLTTLADDLKNTYSDCLKRCAMRFGVALDLWESAEEHDEDAQPVPDPLAAILAHLDGMDKRDEPYADIKQYATERWGELTPEQQQRVASRMRAIQTRRQPASIAG